MFRRLPTLAGGIASGGLLFATLAGGAPAASSAATLVPLAVVAPESPSDATAVAPACTSPAPVHTYAFFHCYSPAQIAGAYGVDNLHAQGLMGEGQTIVLVDAYGSPTAANDIKFFHDT